MNRFRISYRMSERSTIVRTKVIEAKNARSAGPAARAWLTKWEYGKPILMAVEEEEAVCESRRSA